MSIYAAIAWSKILPNEISRLIFFLVASRVKTSFKMDIVDILSDLKTDSPFLYKIYKTWNNA